MSRTLPRRQPLMTPAELRAIRASLGLSGPALARLLRVSLSAVRRWEAGTRLVVENTSEGVLLKRAPVFPETKPAEVFASLPYRGAPKSLEDMEAGIVVEAKRRHARS